MGLAHAPFVAARGHAPWAAECSRLPCVFRHTILLASIAATAAAAPASPPVAAPELELDRVWLVEAPGLQRFQPSGLLLHEDALWTVSDRHGATVFALNLSGETAVVVEVLPGVIDAASDDGRWFDAEGLAITPDGTLLIASEERCRVYRRAPGDKSWSLASPDLSAAGGAAGLFLQHNAAIEGIAALDDDTVIVAAEREARGLLSYAGGKQPTRLAAQQMETSIHPLREDRVLDFADLTVWRGRLFALARNQHLVVELVRDDADSGAWREGAAWSFAATENADRFRYRDLAYGLAEGLAIDDAFIYVVLDNNDDVRESAPEDAHPLLFRFKNPIPR